MIYFSLDFLTFFKELAPNNHKEWFDVNRKRYENSVKKPFENFVLAVIQELAKINDDYKDVKPSECIFRINRDIRFSNDKTPYKLQMSAVVTKGGRKQTTNPGQYFELGPEKMAIYSGIYLPDKDQLLKIRNYIASHLAEFDKLINDKNYLAFFETGIHGEINKVLPAHLKEAATKQPLLFNKQFYWYRHLPPESILKDDLTETMVEHFKASKPLSDFFMKALLS